MPGFGESLGTVFWGGSTDIEGQTWTIGNQVWSDAVSASNCDKTDYAGGGTGNFNADCRNATNAFHGHYFSWCAVIRFRDELCPAPWRVPIVQDFIDLDITLGGTGVNRYGAAVVANVERLVGDSGGSGASVVNGGGDWGGTRFTAAAGGGQATTSLYWSSSESNAANAFRLGIDPIAVYPNYAQGKNLGNALRCVRNK